MPRLSILPESSHTLDIIYSPFFSSVAFGAADFASVEAGRESEEAGRESRAPSRGAPSRGGRPPSRRGPRDPLKLLVFAAAISPAKPRSGR